MVRADTEKMLGANFPAEFVENFWAKAAPEGTAKGLVVKAMAKLWLDTPDDIRRALLYPTASDKPFADVIRAIVKEEIKITSAVILPQEVRELGKAHHKKNAGGKSA